MSLKRVHLAAVMFFCATVSTVSPLTTQAQPTKNPATVKQTTVFEQMSAVYSSYSELLRLLATKEQFFDPKNEKRISELLAKISSEFARLKTSTAKNQEPGFRASLDLVQEGLKDGAERYAEGKTDYAYWRLRTISESCSSCHTRFQMRAPLMGVDPLVGAKLSNFDRAEFYLATQQYDEAETAYLKVIGDPKGKSKKTAALRKLLVIYTRVENNPQKALKNFEALRESGQLSGFERELVQGWIVSLQNWQNESNTSTESSVERAKRLIREAIRGEDPVWGSQQAVDLLRATALLHQELDKPSSQASAINRGELLYLLGLAYSELSQFFPSSLAELFLQEAIKESPETPNSRAAFRKYKALITVNYTGSSGTHIPPEVDKELTSYYNLAYGIKKKSSAK